jgi:hypothetical protein|tara:strand:- start:1741 stop:3006 length:1266 start_codon:yes stop_codon:yes gene_type:complete
MGFKKGISANKFNKSGILDNFIAKHDTVLVGRVTDIILNDNYPDIDKLGGLNAIGNIFFKPVNFNTSDTSYAIPFFPQMSTFPLVNELVLIQKLPGNNMNSNSSNEVFYYINVINLWNSPHHNAFPNLSTLKIQEQSQDTYNQSEQDNPQNTKDPVLGLNLNSPINSSQKTFVERSDIHPLLPFSGDTIYQGRWSNSIRLGSTNRPQDNSIPPLNSWSSGSSSLTGDPISIIRNGQPINSSNKGFIPIIEDINNDLSSLYLTSFQKLPLKPSSENYLSYFSKPILVKDYDQPQILLNSDRVVINAKKDSVLLSAQKSINFSTNDSVNINTKNLLIDAGTIRIGSKQAVESIVLGDTLYFQLSALINALLQMTSILKTSQIWPNGVPSSDIVKNTVYANVETTLELIQEDLKTMLSKNVKTI